MSITFRAAITAATLVLGSAQRAAHGPPPLPSQIATLVTPPGYRALPAAMRVCRLRGFPRCLNSAANRDSVCTTESRMSFRREISGGRTYLQIVESRSDGDQVRQQVIATLGQGSQYTSTEFGSSAAGRPACAPRWARSETPTTTRCARASSPRPNANCSTGAPDNPDAQQCAVVLATVKHKPFGRPQGAVQDDAAPGRDIRTIRAI